MIVEGGWVVEKLKAAFYLDLLMIKGLRNKIIIQVLLCSVVGAVNYRAASHQPRCVWRRAETFQFSERLTELG